MTSLQMLATALGLDLNEVKRLAAMTQEERVQATSMPHYSNDENIIAMN